MNQSKILPSFKDPWKLTANGVMRASDGKLLYIEADERHWESTIAEELDYAYHLYGHGGYVYPSVKTYRRDADSVCCV